MTCLINSIALTRLSVVSGQHRWNGGERSFRVDQQHVELLTHECLERRQGYFAVGSANAAHGFEPTLVDCSPSSCQHRAATEPRLPVDLRPEFAT